MDHHWTHNAAGLHPLAAEAPPRCGATLDGVTRPRGRLVPRWRQAPDGRQSGGRQPTDLSRLNRRIDWLRLFRWTTSPRGPAHAEHSLNIFAPALDSGSHSNARPEPRASARRLHALVRRAAPHALLMA
jgi:hypothetical protein